jgi:predicted DNA-binding transcriptional regulator YafY
MEHGGLRSWLLNTFAVNHLINESHKLKRRILFENIPSGQQFLTPILEAMRDGRTLEMRYRSFWSDESHDRVIEPYCVKVFKQRWYVLGRVPERDIRLFRVSLLPRTDLRFQTGNSRARQRYGSTRAGIFPLTIPVFFAEIRMYN